MKPQHMISLLAFSGTITLIASVYSYFQNLNDLFVFNAVLSAILFFRIWQLVKI